MAHRVTPFLDELQQLDLVQALVEKVLVVPNHFQAHRIFAPSSPQVAALQGSAEGSLADIAADLSGEEEGRQKSGEA